MKLVNITVEYKNDLHKSAFNFFIILKHIFKNIIKIFKAFF